MKFLVALSCLLAVAVAKPGGLHPLAYSYAAPAGFSYSTHTVAHPAVAYAAPIHAAYAAPVHAAYAAPAVTTYAAPAIAAYAAPAPIAHAVAAAPVAHAVAAPVAHAIAPVAAPVAVKSQYHAQDELGQASYGHSEPFQAHHAVQDAAGNKAGSYSYVAPNGQVIHTEYVADALGYRSASNANPIGPAVGPAVPLDTPEVVAARAAHFAAHAAVKSRARRAAQFTPYHFAAAPLAYSAPLLRAATYTTVVNTPGHAYSYHVY